MITTVQELCKIYLRMDQPNSALEQYTAALEVGAQHRLARALVWVLRISHTGGLWLPVLYLLIHLLLGVPGLQVHLGDVNLLLGVAHVSVKGIPSRCTGFAVESWGTRHTIAMAGEEIVSLNYLALGPCCRYPAKASLLLMSRSSPWHTGV